MRTKNIALIALTIMLSIHIQRIEACTRAVYIGPDNLIVTGRTMDWKEDIMSNLYVFPRGIQRAGYNKGETVTWTSKYGSVIATGYDIGTCDGMNEKGLVASLLFLPESVYKRLGDKRPVMGISIWTQYVLDNFATVREAVDELKKEIDSIISDAETYGLNALFLQVRPCADAIYPSRIFPSSAYICGKQSGELPLDVLDYFIAAAHAKNIDVHAWINPYRVTCASSSGYNEDTLAAENPAVLHPEWVVRHSWTENGVRKYACFFNPALPEVRKLICDGVEELIANYDIDGIHFDDYFYPTTDAAFDKASYEKYCADAKNPIALDDWRRANVNTLLAGCRAAIKSIGGERVDFSISPAASIEKNYSEYYADVKLWVKDGIVDTIIPQLYFGFEYPIREFRFDNLMDSWAELAAENKAVKLAVGLAPYKLGTDSEPDSAEWKNGTDIVARQIKACLDSEAVTGYVLFSYTSVFSDSEQAHEQLDKIKEATTATNSQQQQSVQ